MHLLRQFVMPLLLACLAAAPAISEGETEPDLSGTWTMTIQGKTPPGKNYSSLTFEGQDGDLTARIVSSGNTHRALPLTGALCCATAARIKGTVVHRHARAPEDAEADIRLIQPSGILPVACKVRNGPEGWTVDHAAVYRTQRRLFEGRVLIPGSPKTDSQA